MISGRFAAVLKTLISLVTWIIVTGCTPPSTGAEQETLVTIPVTVVFSPTEIPASAPTATPTTTPIQLPAPVPLVTAEPMVLENIDEAPIGCAVLEPSDDGWSSVDNGTRQFNGIGSVPRISLSPDGNRIVINNLQGSGNFGWKTQYSILEIDTGELYRLIESNRSVETDTHVWVDDDRLLLAGDEDRITLIDFSGTTPQATVLRENFGYPLVSYTSQLDESTYIFLNHSGLAFTFNAETDTVGSLAAFDQFALEGAGHIEILGVTHDGWILGSANLSATAGKSDHFLTLYNPETGNLQETARMILQDKTTNNWGGWQPAKQLGQSSIWRINDGDYIIPDDGTLEGVRPNILYNGVFFNAESGDVLDWEDFGLERKQVVVGGDVLPSGEWAIVYLVDELLPSIPELPGGGINGWSAISPTPEDVYLAPASDLTEGFYFENMNYAFAPEPRNALDNVVVLNHTNSDSVSLVTLSDGQAQSTDFSDHFRIFAVFDTFRLTYQWSESILTVSQRDLNGDVLDSLTYESQFRVPTDVVIHKDTLYIVMSPTRDCYAYGSAIVEWPLAEELQQ